MCLDISEPIAIEKQHPRTGDKYRWRSDETIYIVAEELENQSSVLVWLNKDGTPGGGVFDNEYIRNSLKLVS